MSFVIMSHKEAAVSVCDPVYGVLSWSIALTLISIVIFSLVADVRDHRHINFSFPV